MKSDIAQAPLTPKKAKKRKEMHCCLNLTSTHKTLPNLESSHVGSADTMLCTSLLQSMSSLSNSCQTYKAGVKFPTST